MSFIVIDHISKDYAGGPGGEGTARTRVGVSSNQSGEAESMMRRDRHTPSPAINSPSLA